MTSPRNDPRAFVLRGVLVAAGALSSAGLAACGGSSGAATVVTDDVVEDDLLTAGTHVRVEARVKGDVAAAGSEVTISAPVDGYVMSAGRTVVLEGPVGNDIWAAGERVSIHGRVGNNAMVAGQTVRLHPGTTVGHDARLAGGEVRFEGRIVRNLTIGAGTAEIGGDVGGAVHASAERVTLLPGAVVGGDLVVRSPEPPVISPQARVMGEVDYQPRGGEPWMSWPLFWLGSFLALLLLGVVALAVAPAWPARVAETLRQRTLRSALIGAIVLVGIPIAIVLLLMTVIGIPLAVVVTGLYVAALVLSGVFVSHRVGQWLLERLNRAGASRWSAMTLGALVVSFGVSLPAVGWAIALAVLVMGAGALALERRQGRRQHPLGA